MPSTRAEVPPSVAPRQHALEDKSYGFEISNGQRRSPPAITSFFQLQDFPTAVSLIGESTIEESVGSHLSLPDELLWWLGQIIRFERNGA